ncbi:P-loop containing nucleoside triphosphate hydrolase protein [Pholiota conissans]|uniref:RNA helicase n=1 Tax=Pholiota conissans TaxID=109636 RepID=A0A9P5ZD22_9AGAR|nr:P-loop containing nucleoside triphosphate hydrolase protein [Pholiota conissans]
MCRAWERFVSNLTFVDVVQQTASLLHFRLSRVTKSTFTMAGPPVRESYNAKARGSTAGSRKKGKPKKKSKLEQPEEQDSNAAVITPKSQEDKGRERKEKLLQELASQSESRWTNKKKKRLEKYIDKKLKKEERLLIFDKLAKTQASMSSALLQSSSTLGTGKLSTFEERQDKAEDALVRKTLAGQIGKRKRHQDVYDIHGAEGDGDRSESDDDEEEESRPRKINKPVSRGNEDREEDLQTPAVVVVEGPVNTPPNAVSTTAVGSALQRSADGSAVSPKIRQRPKGKPIFQRGWGRQLKHQNTTESDTSFDSSDSGNDSTGDDESDNDEKVISKSEEDENQEDESMVEPVKKKSLGFKDWAMKQLGAAKGYTLPKTSNDSITNPESSLQPPPKKRKIEGTREMRGPLGEDLKLPTTTFAQRLLQSDEVSKRTYVKSVQIKRPQDVEEARILLPIVTEEQPIMEAILLNPVVVICGETGSGKTTQVPQFLYEAGFGTPGSENPGMIGITQPRRVAAMSMAARVGHELSLTSLRVSYQIRYDATVSSATSIKFMTDGVLLRELATDFLLTKYSVIIVDEAHERSINTDILIGVLSRVIKLRENLWKEGNNNVKPLRLIIMSATLRVSDFAENATLFTSPPPVINVAARQHPVTIHFSRRTYPDYVSQAIKKTIKIHTRLPPGGILIFLTGQAEIAGVCRKLEAKFSQKAIQDKKRKRSQAGHRQDVDRADDDLMSAKSAVAAAQADVEAEEVELGNSIEEDLAFDVDENIEREDDPEGLESDEDDKLNEELRLEEESDLPMHIVPLYSLLPSDKQMRVFEPPPAGHRLVVVSTNIAETSLTIPGIRYVVDCGRAKERHYAVTNGIQSFQVSWIAKASAAQRAGRAGRTGPGHCYRLYSSALFEHHFEKFTTPEIQRMPIEGVVLQMKSMHIDAVVNFPFPTPPNRFALQKAEKTLCYLGALTPANVTSTLADHEEGQATNTGRSMALFPLSPRFARMLVSGQQHGCLPYVICLVSALSVGDPFIYEEALGLDDPAGVDDDVPTLSNLKSESVRAKEERQLLRKAFFKSQHVHCSLGKYTSDLFKILSVVGAYEYAGGGQTFCSKHFVRPKAMEEIHKLRAQISAIVQANFPGIDSGFIPQLSPPTDHQLKVLKQLLTAGFIDQVAVRKDIVDKQQGSGAKYSNAKGVAYQALGIQEDVYIHPSSLLIGAPPADYLIFTEVVRSSRVYLKGLTVINPAWLSSLGKDTLCTFSKPIPNNVGTLMTIPRFGPQAWELPAIKASRTS